MNKIDLATFQKANNVLEGYTCLIVVKSQDQFERRARLLKTKNGKKFGRIKPRDTAIGLLMCGTLKNGGFVPEWRKEFREPRHIKQLNNGEFLLTEINRVLKITNEGKILKEYTHPFFGFLHTVDVRSDEKRMLVVSSGYDSVIEFDLETGDEIFRWTAWDHGFNPDEDGNWLTLDPKILAKYRKDGKNGVLIDPLEHGEQGLITSHRTAHPNVATYDPYENERSIIISIGHDGHLYRILVKSMDTSLVMDQLNQMPHGLFPYQGGWVITNTTRGEWWKLTADFKPLEITTAANLDGKVQGTDDVEWVQQVVPVGKNTAIFIDSNRGLLAVDFSKKQYTIYQADPNWCIQDALFINNQV